MKKMMQLGLEQLILKTTKTGFYKNLTAPLLTLPLTLLITKKKSKEVSQKLLMFGEQTITVMNKE